MEEKIRYDEEILKYGLGDSHRKLIEFAGWKKRVLDIGCSTGYLSQALKEKGCKTVGIERDERAALRAEKNCEKVLRGSIEDEKLFHQIEESFDVIILGDVLEHLVTPEEVLKKLKFLIKPGGFLLLSIPNIAHWTIRRNLFLGRFDYEEYGLLDKTHLRFFTQKSIIQLLHHAGYQLEKMVTTLGPMPLDSLMNRHHLLARVIRFAVIKRLLSSFFPSLFGYQFVIKSSLLSQTSSKDSGELR